MKSGRIPSLSVLFALAAVAVWVFVLGRKYIMFGYCDWDLALFAQGMWSLVHADGHASIFERHLLANHANIIAFFILPVYYLVQHPFTLVVLKVLSYALAGFGLFHLASPRVGRGYALWLMLLYYLYAPNVFGLLHDFDFESLAPAFLVGLLYFFEKQRWRAFMVTAFFLMTVKENMPLVVLAFGLYGLLTAKNRIAWGVVPVLVSGLVFLFLVKIFIPLMASGNLNAPLPYAGNYAYFWQDGWLAGAAKLWGVLTQPANRHLVQELFGPLCFLPVFGWEALFLVSPLFLQHFLSASLTEHTIYFYYGMALAPFIFLGTATVLGRLQRFLPARGFLCLAGLVTVVYLMDGIGRWPVYAQRTSCAANACEAAAGVPARKWTMIRRIPPEASVVASFAFLTPLSQRREVYPFYRLYSKRFQEAARPWVLPPSVLYAIIDLNDPWMVNELPSLRARTLEAVKACLGGPDWDVLDQTGQTYLLKRRVP